MVLKKISHNICWWHFLSLWFLCQ